MVTLEIVIDCDSDQIRLIGYQGSTEHKPVTLTMKPRTHMGQMRDALLEVINAVTCCDWVQVRQQSDGEVRTLDEWKVR